MHYARYAILIVAASILILTPTMAQTDMIQQGDPVSIGGTYDISGVVPPYPQLAYWDGYDMYDSVPSYNITLPDNRSGYYDFYINPDIFLTRLGKWYKYDGHYESNSNNLAFVVVLYQKNQTLTFPNGTVVNQSIILQNETIRKLLNPTPEILPEKHESDYLITTDESFNITVDKTTAMWLFDGSDNSILYTAGESSLVFNRANISHLQPGEYTLLLQTIGNSTTGFDVVYSNHSIKWFDQRNFQIHELDTTSMVPSVAIETLKTIFPQTRDAYVIKRLSVQKPEVIITQMNEMISTSAKTYYNDPSRRGNVSIMDVRGYVNALPGTNITVTLDPSGTYIKDQKFTTFETTAVGGYEGNWRQWRVTVPFYWDALTSGEMHTISARSALGGGTAYSDFMVNEMPSDSYIPSDTVKWAGDRNPWVPTPTPVVVIQTQEVPVTQYVLMNVTPSDEQVKAQQEIAIKENNAYLFGIALEVVAGILALVVLFFVARFLYRAHQRRKWMQK